MKERILYRKIRKILVLKANIFVINCSTISRLLGDCFLLDPRSFQYCIPGSTSQTKLQYFLQGDIRSEFEAELAKEREEAERRQEEEERQSRELARRLADEEQDSWSRAVTHRNSQTQQEHGTCD